MEDQVKISDFNKDPHFWDNLESSLLAFPTNPDYASVRVLTFYIFFIPGVVVFVNVVSTFHYVFFFQKSIVVSFLDRNMPPPFYLFYIALYIVVFSPFSTLIEVGIHYDNMHSILHVLSFDF
jgi:hypothetical protein